MGILIVGLLSVLAIACTSHNAEQRENAVDSSGKVGHSYAPGLGEFMMGIPMHHAKLWFAGINQNWELSKFEIDEIKESMEDIQTYCNDRPEVKSLPMIEPALDSVRRSIDLKDPALFRQSFITLTNTCNSCHVATQHGFNVVTIPDRPPVTNQDFKPRK